ncbi:hypothetical protein ECG_01755 [Echinococcus granulosus]|uniref:Expressed protein n=1 Tax=Echinococcus granulosus TaxID=6210 RepID=A0A068WCC1_ECHGR|nr:hypothetical protein ECG_01755 [Echinococcus granulosus]CDS15301.1 expressed protein [Echinococcus granulosus]
MFVLSTRAHASISKVDRAELIYSTPMFPAVAKVRQLSLSRFSPSTIHSEFSLTRPLSVELCIVTMHLDLPNCVHTAFHILDSVFGQKIVHL